MATALPAKVEVWGHRGGEPAFPENSLAGFEAALKGGCDAIEADVRMLKDGVLVFHHDPRFGHTVQAKGAVRDWNWRNGVDTFTTRSPPHTTIPRFTTLLRLLMRPEYSHVKFNIDCKPENRHDVVFEAIHKDVVEVAGPDHATTLGPRLWLSIYTPWHTSEAARTMPYARRLHLGVDIMRARQVWNSVDGFSMAFHNLCGPGGDRFRQDCRRAGKLLAVWTVNQHHEWLECMRWNVDVVITDFCAEYRAWSLRLASDQKQLKALSSGKTTLPSVQWLSLFYNAMDNLRWQKAFMNASTADVVHIQRTNPPSPLMLAEKLADSPRIEELELPGSRLA